MDQTNVSRWTSAASVEASSASSRFSPGTVLHVAGPHRTAWKRFGPVEGANIAAYPDRSSEIGSQRMPLAKSEMSAGKFSVYMKVAAECGNDVIEMYRQMGQVFDVRSVMYNCPTVSSAHRYI